MSASVRKANVAVMEYLTGEGPLLADCVEEVFGATVCDVTRNQGVREFVCSQAGIGADSGISFASFRRFWTVAARRNSS